MKEKIKIFCKKCQNYVNVSSKKYLRKYCKDYSYCSLECFKDSNDFIIANKISHDIRIKKIRSNGGFEKNGNLSKITRAKNFFKKLEINIDDLSNDQLLEKFKNEFDKKEHGKKIINGYKKIHGNDLSEFYKKRNIKQVFIKNNLSMDEISFMDQKQIDKLVKEYFKNFKVKNKIEWKKTHLLNLNLIKKDEILSKEKINILYSEYLSDRLNRNSLEIKNNGWKKTEKNWYQFKNFDKKIFYRSSWELKVLKSLDELIEKKEILEIIDVPKIPYFLNKRRHYYPDVSFKDKFSNIKILEIKPKKHIDFLINVKKFESAFLLYKKDFLILNEDHIFSKNKNLTDYIIEVINARNN